MRNLMKRRLAWAVFGACLLAATTITGAQNQNSPASGEPIELFAKLMPVFSHPRCMNCHGRVDPFYEYKGPPQVEHGGDVIGDPKDPPMSRIDACGGCHDATKEIENSWVLATLMGPHLNWLGKNTGEMCELQAHEVKRMKTAARTWMEHLTVDVLITQSFDGMAGGARSGPPEKPPMKREEFLKAAQAWVNAGAACSWLGTIKQTETFASNYDFSIPGAAGKTTVLQSASRTVIIARDPGATTADIKMSGQLTQTTVKDAECRPTVVIGADWNNGNARNPGPANVRFKIAADGSYVIYFQGPPEKTIGIDTLKTSSSCGSLGSFPPSSTELDWDPWKFTIGCPPNPVINTARGESIDCDAFDAEKSPRLKGKMTRVIVNMWDAADRQSWLAVSPASTGRGDTGESLPVTVVTEWDFQFDELSPDARSLRQ